LSGVAERKRRSEIHDATANLKRICKLLTVRPVWHPRLERAKMRTAATTLKASQKEPNRQVTFLKPAAAKVPAWPAKVQPPYEGVGPAEAPLPSAGRKTRTTGSAEIYCAIVEQSLVLNLLLQRLCPGSLMEYFNR
jgi:hypothetical protein